MFNFRLKANRVTEHSWFAWYPVIATKKGPNGFTYHWVWLHRVTRKFVRAAGISQWTHEIA